MPSTSESPASDRFSSIDGLRGYLALSVFLHHACVWYFYLRSGNWLPPPSPLYVHLGQSSVALFFMITAFLFCTKILDSQARPFDWTRLYVGRILRLGPLYLFCMFLLFITVVYLSGGKLNEPLGRLAPRAARWLGFAAAGSPRLNGVDVTKFMALATWTLSYEWAFYFSLPILALVARSRPLLIAAMAGVTGAALLFPGISVLYYILAFIGGIAAALLVRWTRFTVFSSRPLAAFLALGLLAGAVLLFPSASELAPLAMLSTFFCLIAGGNSLFGALTCSASRSLGEITYGIYLLHGIALFVVFRIIVGDEGARLLSPVWHWTIVGAMCPFLLLISRAAFCLIERPAIEQTDALAMWVRSRFPP